MFVNAKLVGIKYVLLFKCVKVPGNFTPDGLFRTNKLILTNPQKLTQEVVLDLYNKMNLPDRTIPDVLALLAIRGFTKAADRLIEEKINNENMDEFINNYIEFENDIHDNNYGLYNEYKDKLLELKNRGI